MNHPDEEDDMDWLTWLIPTVVSLIVIVIIIIVVCCIKKRRRQRDLGKAANT